METLPRYDHTQVGRLHYVLLGAMLLLVLALMMRRVPWHHPAALGLLGGVVLLPVAAAAFHRLTVTDRGDYLLLLFGPLPIFRKRIRYDRIINAQPARTSFVDGWGIHYVPGRGWTYNIWGFDCVRVQTNNGTIRIGTDDPQGLAEFLRRAAGPAKSAEK